MIILRSLYQVKTWNLLLLLDTELADVKIEPGLEIASLQLLSKIYGWLKEPENRMKKKINVAKIALLKPQSITSK